MRSAPLLAAENAITVEDALDLDVLREGEAVVLAGEESLSRQIRWVHISDLPTAAPSLRGGELLLTHGLSLRHSVTMQKRYVKELAGVPIAGLVLELGRGFDRVPRAMIEEASANQLPLIALRKRIRFVDLTEQVHGRIMRQHYSLVEDAQQLGRELMSVPSRGAGLSALLSVLAERLGNPVVLEDAAHEVVDYAEHGAALDPVLSAWPSHSHSAHEDAVPGRGREERRSPRCVCEPIMLRGQVWGRLHVLEMDTELAPETALAVQYGAWAAMLILLQRLGFSSLADYAGGSLISEVLARRLSPTETVAKARTLGADFAGSVATMAVELHERERDAVSGRESHALLERVAQNLSSSLGGRAGGCLTRIDDFSRTVLLAFGANPDNGAEGAISAAVEAIGRATEGTAWGARVGAGEFCEAAQLADSLEHAREAASLANGAGIVSVARYQELGIEKLFLKLAEGPELATYVEAELGPLLEHDARSASPLLPVVEAYLASGCSKSEAARALYMSRRSLYYKLSSIEELLECSLDDVPKRTSIEVALRGLRTIQARSACAPGARRTH